MISIASIKKEISEIVDEIQTTEIKKSVETRLRKKIAFLRQCIRYIQTNPSVEFIKSESQKLENFINAKMKEFDSVDHSLMARASISKIRKEFEKMYDIPKKRTQLRTLKFLLSQ